MALQQVTSDMITDANVLTQHIANLNVTPAKLSQPLTQGTAVASTSGTSVGFTGIPSWAKRITVIFNGVSTSGISQVQVQLGSTTYATTGYTNTSASINSGAGGVTSITSGIAADNSATSAATNTLYGSIVFHNVSGNTWIASGVTMISATGVSYTGGGVTLAGVLDRLQVTTVNGTDTFDAGSINILYE